ncbi:MAG: putative membrane protein [uncultured Nocardioidaceae bacterium]|uniref:Putative membrane protein n=1 Tax=uncultured Nocardioidaceae bacterium TaxID=253824 RepID=A0A6J4N9V8_9ACTN|nr:MAG: putative membrane protein [uncultured Nocardioidaceae bacterium]
MPEKNTRDHDIVVFGATGFTGRLTAEYLAEHAPADCRWALAGRNMEKLEAVRSGLAEIDPALAELPLLTADVTDADSLRAVAESARVVITTVGPYLQHGEPLVAACAAAGTDYVDLTGEPEFVDQMYLDHHQTAVASGARLVHCCGFDSIPHDLGVLFTVKQLPADVPLTIRGVVRSDAAFSGGTFHSALNQFSRGRQLQRAASERKKIEARPEGRRVRAQGGKPRKDPELGYWLMPLPTVDPTIVKRSAAARDDYGPDFTYSHYAGFKSLPYAGGSAVGVVGLFAAAQVPPVRSQLLKRVPQGEGPSERKRAKSWFTVEFVGEGGGQQVRTKVAGGDPGYDETAKMLAESALCLAFDDNPAMSGQVTTAAAMGEHLLDRLSKSGISFTVE